MVFGLNGAEVQLPTVLACRGWAKRQLAEGQSNVLRQALPLFESIMIEAALRHTGGRKAEAAELLGWGRNTLTRKLKDLDLPAT